MTDSQKAPFYVEAVTAGERYSCCSCGESSDMPFCDGINCSEDSEAVLYKAETSKTVKFCGCRQSKDLPLCDGSHSSQT